MLGDRCLGTLQDFADREGKRLVLIVENLNMMFRDIVDKDAGWRLRHTLQTEPRIVLLASATSRFDEISNPDFAFYDLFRELTLYPLDSEECAVLWQNVSGRDRPPETIRALRILTGGSPRLLTIVARFGANLSFRELMADLLDLIDDHTEYFKSHLDALPAQERRIYLALADLWIPATAREIADRARLDTSKCSAHLARLVERGAVEVTGGSVRRKQYYITERLYNIYYLMRRSRGTAPLVEALIEFMEAFFLPSELKDFFARTAREAMGLDGEAKRMYQIVFNRLLESPLLSVRREELNMPKSRIDPLTTEKSDGAKLLFNKARAIAGSGQDRDEIELWDEVVRRLQTSNSIEELEMVAIALICKGTALNRLNQTDEAFAAWDEVVHRFGTSEEPILTNVVATALNWQAVWHREQGRPKEALAICEEVLHRFDQDGTTLDFFEIASALHLRGIVLCDLNLLEEALVAWDDIICRFESSDSLIFRDEVAAILVKKGETLELMNREEEALVVWEDVFRRFGSSDASSARISVASSLVLRGLRLVDSNRPQDVLDLMDEAIQRFGLMDDSLQQNIFSVAHVAKAWALVSLNRLSEAIEVYDEVLNHYSGDSTFESTVAIASSMFAKGAALVGLNRLEAALIVWNDVVQRFGTSDQPMLQDQAKMAQLKIAELHLTLGQGDASVAAVNRLFESESVTSTEIGCWGRLTRARAHLLGGNEGESLRDIEEALSIIPMLSSLPMEILDNLCELAVDMEPLKLRELIIDSPVSNLLLPMTTALEMELGLETRVAKEIEEVAEEIRMDMEWRRKKRLQCVD